MTMLWNILGPSALAGLGVMALLLPANLGVATIQQKLEVCTLPIKYMVSNILMALT